jgi:N-acetylornithine carbamoyltransferase
MSLRHFYDLAELPRGDVEDLVSRGRELARGAAAKRFPGRALGLLFLDPSLRTQASFQRAAGRLGLDLVQPAGGIWNLETDESAVMDGDKAEHVKEAAAVLGRYVDVLGVRSFAQGGAAGKGGDPDRLTRGFERYAGVPVINLESARFHPCQALADRLTLDSRELPQGGRFVLSWAWHPKSLPVAVPNSTLLMAAQRGMDVVLLRPDGYDLDADVMARASDLASKNGGRLRATSDRTAAMEDALVLYAKSWGCPLDRGDPAAEAVRRARLRDEWCVRESWFAGADGDAVFMHCLPVRRGVVVEADVLDSRRSIVIDQAENRLHAQTALLEALLTGLDSSPQRGHAAQDREDSR